MLKAKRNVSLLGFGVFFRNRFYGKCMAVPKGMFPGPGSV